MIIYSSYLIFGFCTILFFVSMISLRKLKNVNAVPASVFLLLAASYSLMATNFIMLIFMIIHLNPSIWFLFHFHDFMSNSHKIIASISFIKIDYMSIFIVISYPILLFFIFILSQSILFLISAGLEENINRKYSKRLQNLIRNNNTWLNDCNIKIIDDTKVDAFAFTLFKLHWMKIKKVDIIILTTSLLDLVTNDELELILAHEYAHTKEFQTIYSNIIVFICSLFFFVPLFNTTRNLIQSTNEIKADEVALELINKPLTLARALFKLFVEIPSINGDISSSTAFLSGNNSLVIHRISLLIKYAEVNDIHL